MDYAELHCHSYYSFHDGASSLEEIMMRARELGYRALALTDHDNLCGAMCFANLAASLDVKGIIGAEITISSSHHSERMSEKNDITSPLTPLHEWRGVRGEVELAVTGAKNVLVHQDDTLSLRTHYDKENVSVCPPLKKGDKGGFITAKDDIPPYHLTLLAENHTGYSNLSRLITAAHASGERNSPELPKDLLAEHSDGLIALSGCRQGQLSQLVEQEKIPEARDLILRYMDWFGPENYFIELQHNLVFGDSRRIKALLELARETGAGVVATGNVHYHVRERHQLQDCLVAIKHCKSLEETHRERRPNSEFYLRSREELEELFRECPEAVRNTVRIADRCNLDITRDLCYQFPDYDAPDGHTPETYLEKLCYDAAVRRYGSVTPAVKERLDEEFRLINKYHLSGFLLLYHEVIKLGREVMIDLGLSDPSLTIEENPPGRGRGSSVSLLAGYLIGLSHIDPLQYNLSLERFLPDDIMTNVPDIDLDFPRSIREELILRTHRKWGWERAVLTGTIVTYKIRGAIRDLGKALGLPQVELDRVAKQTDWGSARRLKEKMLKMPGFSHKVDLPGWCDLIRLAAEIDAFPRYMGQHPGGMVISSSPLTDIVPVQRGAIEGRYVCQWDKDSIDDAGFVKIDFLALGTLSQLQEAVEIIRERTGERLDMSRIDFGDKAVYDSLCSGDTIGIFQVESSAQMQTITRLQPRNLLDMAHEVGAVRPGVGVNNGVQEYLARRNGRKLLTYDHPLEQRALERTLGVVLFQDQVNQLAIDVAGFSPSEADRLRRAFSKRHNEELVKQYHQKFLEGAMSRGVDEEASETIFKKFNGQYMFPESHAFAFGVTAYQSAWLKYYYPLEFFVGIFNQQPMGFYNLETLKQDAGRHGVGVLNPDINLSRTKCVIEKYPVSNKHRVIPADAGISNPSNSCRSSSVQIKHNGSTIREKPLRDYDSGRGEENGSLRLGFLQVQGIGKASAEAIENARRKGPFRSIGEFLERTGVLEEVALNLASAGAFDSIEPNRRKVKWEIGLRYRPVNSQLVLPLPVEQDLPELESPGDWERMRGEYSIMGLYPSGHVMARLRPSLSKKVQCSRIVNHLADGSRVLTAGLVIRRQRPHGKVVFLTLEDEFGLIPCMVFPRTFAKYEYQFKSPFIVINGRMTVREGTRNVVVTGVKAFNVMHKTPKAKNWQ
ncbi:MAG: DNA polymerase III subunit alpha [Dehalococcoidales bacterium]|nr:DNA polymerase III subunit alpha [Dehalococcoidales bacterium]